MSFPFIFCCCWKPACSGESESKIGRKEIREDKSFREKTFFCPRQNTESLIKQVYILSSLLSLVVIICRNPFCHGWRTNVNVNGSNISAFVSTLILIILNVSWKATLNYRNSLLYTCLTLQSCILYFKKDMFMFMQTWHDRG